MNGPRHSTRGTGGCRPFRESPHPVSVDNQLKTRGIRPKCLLFGVTSGLSGSMAVAAIQRSWSPTLTHRSRNCRESLEARRAISVTCRSPMLCGIPMPLPKSPADFAEALGRQCMSGPGQGPGLLVKLAPPLRSCAAPGTAAVDQTRNQGSERRYGFQPSEFSHSSDDSGRAPPAIASIIAA